MRMFILTALALVGFGVGAANAQSLAHSAAPHGTQYNFMAGGGG